MNYLVHLYLSGCDPEYRLGGLMGDFVKGQIPADVPEKVAQGLRLHRRIDTLSLTSEHTRRSRQRLGSRYGHGRGIIVDIFYDHFLASSWQDFSGLPLKDYAAEVYRLLEERHAQLPPALQQVARRMISHNWLVSYSHQEVVGRALQRIADRLSRPLPLAEGLGDLQRHEAQFREDFKAFMAEATALAGEEFAIYTLTP